MYIHFHSHAIILLHSSELFVSGIDKKNFISKSSKKTIKIICGKNVHKPYIGLSCKWGEGLKKLKKSYVFFERSLPCGNRTRELIGIRTDSPSCNREPVGLSDQEPARNVTPVWLCSRHEGWSGTGRAIRPGTRQKRIASLVMFPTWRLVGNRSGYPALFWLFFKGVLSSIKICLEIIIGWIISSNYYKLCWNKLTNILFNRSNNLSFNSLSVSLSSWRCGLLMRLVESALPTIHFLRSLCQSLALPRTMLRALSKHLKTHSIRFEYASDRKSVV